MRRSRFSKRRVLFSVHSFLNSLGYSLVVKPLALVLGRGVKLAFPRALQRAVLYCSVVFSVLNNFWVSFVLMGIFRNRKNVKY